MTVLPGTVLMANNIEGECPPTCPLRPMTHQHFIKAEGQPKKHKKKRRQDFDDGGDSRFMTRRSEQKRLYKRKR